MGLFDGIFGGSSTNTRLSTPEAFAGILMATAAAEGHISDEEVDGLITVLRRMKLYEAIPGEKLGQMLSRLHGMVKKGNPIDVMRRCAECLPAELHQTVFANAANLVLADGTVEDEEKEFLDALTGSLRITQEQATTIVKVMVIKNRG